jgi:predicted acyl esterase
VALFAATDARDSDWIVRLVDVHPDGRAFNVTDGAVRARYRSGPEELLEPAQVCEYRIDLHDVHAPSGGPGDQQRVPARSPHPHPHQRHRLPPPPPQANTGDALLDDAALTPVLQTVLYDTEQPSRITLPVIPQR